MSNIDRLYKNIPLILPKYIFSKKVKTKILKKNVEILALLEELLGCGTIYLGEVG